MEPDPLTRPIVTPAGGPRTVGERRLREGSYIEAADALRAAVDADPADAVAWRLLGGALASTGDFGAAVPAFERALALAPDSARSHYNLALALQGLRRHPDAIICVDRALAIAPDYQLALALRDALKSDIAAHTDLSAPAPNISAEPLRSEPRAMAAPEAARPLPVGPPADQPSSEPRNPAPPVAVTSRPNFGRPAGWVVLAVVLVLVVLFVFLAGHGGGSTK